VQDRLYNQRGMGGSMVAELRVWRYLLPMVVLSAMLFLASGLRSQDISVVGTPQQINDRIKELASNSKPAVHDYVIGDGDLLSITVFDVPELNRDVRVSQTGKISIPLVPVRLEVTGLSELQAEQKIAEVLESNGLVSHPEVGVVVKEHKSKPITIVGAVGRPMVYETDRPVNLLEAIAAAGGVSNDAGDTVIVTRAHSATYVEIPNATIGTNGPPGPDEPADLRLPANAAPAATQGNNPAPGTSFPSGEELAKNPVPTANTNPAPASDQKPPSGNTITVSLGELVESGDMRNNIPLEGGDVVTVPHGGTVYVLGAVTRPGGFVVSNDRNPLTALKILTLAGGFTRTAKASHTYIIRQDAQGKQTEMEIDLKKVLNRQAEDVPMHPSDILYVPNDTVKAVALQAIALAVALGSSVVFYHIAYQ
jgi:protein involved in polysaccharide export with SLBB domain